MKEAELADELHLADPPEPPLTGPLTSINALIARWCMVLSVAGLLFIVVIVFWQVFGRYVLNSSPTWTESRPATSLIGASSGSDPSGSWTVS